MTEAKFPSNARAFAVETQIARLLGAGDSFWATH